MSVASNIWAKDRSDDRFIRSMRLYSYIVTHDTGFSPNPFWGYCTLAGCKPVIRRTIKEGDWIIGLSPKANQYKIVYAMRVDEILGYAEYYCDKRFFAKIPDYVKEKIVYRCGDNIYKPLADGQFKQLRSMHSNGTEEDQKNKIHDLGGKNVLISKTFYYFGSRSIDLPVQLQELCVGRGHKCNFDDNIKRTFLDFISKQQLGINSPPTKWPNNDTSYRHICL